MLSNQLPHAADVGHCQDQSDGAVISARQDVALQARRADLCLQIGDEPLDLDVRHFDRALEYEVCRASVRGRHRHLQSGTPCSGIGHGNDGLNEAQLTGIPQRNALRRVEADAQLMPKSGRKPARYIERRASHGTFNRAYVLLPDLRERPNLALCQPCREACSADLAADSVPELARALATDIGGT